MLLIYGNLGEALSVAYPDHHWIIGRFSNSPQNSMKIQKNVRDFFELFVKKELKITKKEDWYNVTREQINQLKGELFSVKKTAKTVTVKNWVFYQHSIIFSSFFSYLIFFEGENILRIYGDLGKALAFAYPEEDWVLGTAFAEFFSA